jgi:hypothetical protein
VKRANRPKFWVAVPQLEPNNAASREITSGAVAEPEARGKGPAGEAHRQNATRRGSAGPRPQSAIRSASYGRGCG